MKSIQLLITLVLFGCISCNGIDLPDEAAPCLKERIKEFKKTKPCKGSTVDEYVFQGRTVYLMDANLCCCDWGSAVYDFDCNFLGSVGGGWTDNVINGLEFYHNATYVTTFWEKR